MKQLLGKYKKKIKIAIKNSLIIKIAKERQLKKYYKEKLEEHVLSEREYMDQLNNYKRQIRDLTLKVNKYENSI